MKLPLDQLDAFALIVTAPVDDVDSYRASSRKARGSKLACELRGDRVKTGGKVAPCLAGVIDV